MKPIRDIEKVIKKDLNAIAGSSLHDRILADMQDVQDQSERTTPASSRIQLWRFNMKISILKIAAAAIVIVAVLGLVKLFDSDSTSGVVWADVLTKVQNSRGVIYRQWITDVNDTSTQVLDCEITYLTPTQYRSEGYRQGKLWMTMWDNRETWKRVVLLHFKNGYVLEDMKSTEKGNQKHANFQNPSWWIEMFMSCEYTKLKPQVIDGVLCEGIETRDLALISKDVSNVNNLVAQLWVSIETGYPVKFEGKFYGDERCHKTTFDQFQWNTEIDPSVFKPKIPEDYEQM